MVSVVIPVYNGEQYIAQAIQSVLEQSLKVDEIIVIDDASTDRTEQVVKSEFSRWVHYHRNPKNMERCYSRNLGVSLAKGEYVFFLDHDDLWGKNHVEKLRDALKVADMVYSFPRTLVNSEGKILRVSRKKIPKDYKILVFSGMVGYPSATAFRKESFLGYKDQFMLREDWEIFLRAVLKGLKVEICDTNTVKIREHGKRSSKSIRLYEGTMAVYSFYREKIPEEYLPYFLFHVGDVCMRFGNLKEGWKLVLSSLSKKPELLLSGRNLLTILKRGFRFWKNYA